MIVLDGSEGEGGGQVLRSALSLSLITRQPFRLDKVRAKRRPPGLKAQHLTCVEGAAAIGQARVEGASLGSHQVTFFPGETTPGTWAFHVGTAGSMSLLLQCLAYPLALAGGGEVTLSGGSHVIASPSVDYLTSLWVPLLARFGLDLTVKLETAGFFPEGGGRLWARVQPARHDRSPDLAPASSDRLVVRSISGGLPLDVARRQADTARRLLKDTNLPVDVEVDALPVAHSRGSAVLISASAKGVVRGAFSSLGARGLPAEEVARSAVAECRAWLRSRTSLDAHAGDQVLLPMGLAAAGLLGTPRVSRFQACALSDHLSTHARVLEAFLPIIVSITGAEVEVRPRVTQEL